MKLHCENLVDTALSKDSRELHSTLVLFYCIGLKQTEISSPSQKAFSFQVLEPVLRI